MATRVELDQASVKAALEQAFASAKRARNATIKPAFVPIYEKDMAALQHAITTLTEIK